MKQVSSSSHGSKDKHRRSKSDDSKRSRSYERHAPLEASHTKSQKQAKHDSKEMDIELSEAKTLMEQLPKEYQPISSFVDDKEELIEQLFTCITGSDLTQMMPKALRGYTMDELKKSCYNQLKKMSRRLILHVLEGEDPSSFVEEKTEADVTTESEKTTSDAVSDNPTLKRKLKEQTEGLPDDERNPKRCALEEIPLASVQRTSPERSDTASNEDFLELYPSSKEMETLAEIDKKDLPPQEDSKDSDLELLELQMRARAIRSLLRARGLPSSEDEEERGKDL